MSIGHFIPHYRRQLTEREAQTAQTLTNVHKQITAQLQPQLTQLARDLDAMQQRNASTPLSWLYEHARLPALIQRIASAMQQFGQFAQMTIQQLQHWAMQLGGQAAKDFLQTMQPLLPLLPRSLADLFAGFGHEAAHLVETTLIRGLSLGSSAAELSKEITQDLTVSRNRALTIASTELYRIFREMTIGMLRANDAAKQWMWWAQLSSSTCAACIALHGTLHKMSEPMLSHPNCRCIAVPVLDTSKAYRTGIEWFNDQAADVQRQILGPAKYAAFKRGDLSLSDLVGHSHHPQWRGAIYEKSLNQLRSA